MNRRDIAVVEHDAARAAALQKLLSGRGYDVVVYETPGRFFDALLRGVPQATVVEARLPGMDGTDVVRVLRGHPQTRGLCILLLADPGTAGQPLAGLDAGADEVLIRPLDEDLLVARLGSLLPRTGKSEEPPTRALSLGGLEVDLDARLCRLQGREIALTRIEFDLLCCLLRNRDRVLTRGTLIAEVWRGRSAGAGRTVDKHVEALRKKLRVFKGRIDTIYGVGYCFRA